MTDKVLGAGFDHPCKNTCSGWQQGYERGKLTVQQKFKNKLERYKEALEFYANTNSWRCDHPLDKAFAVKDLGKIAREALEGEE